MTAAYVCLFLLNLAVLAFVVFIAAVVRGFIQELEQPEEKEVAVIKPERTGREL